ncbi:uncharacterized protein ZBIST_2827 [Zygosaccharomyces bailii]|nr:uncharacterized protein ZBIST_2827 [Zygosaccharomyces bailii]
MRLLETLKAKSAARQLQNPFKAKSEDQLARQSDEGDFDKGTLAAHYLPDDYSFKSVPVATYNTVRPLLALLKAHESKRYYEHVFDPSQSTMWYISLKEKPGEEVLVQRLVLVGTFMILGGDDFGTLNINLVNEMGNAGTEQIREDGLSLDNGQLLLSCNSVALRQRLKKLCLLSIFEYMSIFKALTGTIISTVGFRMPDMHLVLSSAFNFKDWCEVYFEDRGWVKLWCHINRVPRSVHDKLSSQRQIKFYKDNKSMSASNLVCFIPETEYIQDVFFYRERTDNSLTYFQSNEKTLLDDLTTIKLLGNVCFPKETSQRRLLHYSSSMSLRSSKSTCEPDATGKVHNHRKSIFGPLNGHKRNASQDSSETTYSNVADMSKLNIEAGGLLIRPLAHEGLGHLEAMVRFIIPIMDIARKYGRPGNFIKDRCDLECMMFGLPRLPSVDYFALQEMNQVLEEETLEDSTNPRENTILAMSQFSNLLSECISRNPERENEYHFQKLGSILGGDETGSEIPREGGYLSVSSNSLSII